MRIEANTLKKAEGKAFAEGEAKSRAEERLELAKMMLSEGVTGEIAAKIAGLTLPEVETLKSK